MTPVESIERIMLARESEAVPRLDPRYPVWHVKPTGILGGPGGRSCRNDVLHAARAAAPDLFIHCMDSPHDYGVGGAWSDVSTRPPPTPHRSGWLGRLFGSRSDRGGYVCRVPEDVDLADGSFEPWLGVGGWCLYGASAPVEPDFPDLFHEPAVAVAFLTENSVDFAIGAFYDDLEWAVALRPTERRVSR